MKMGGHREITKRALKEFSYEVSRRPQKKDVSKQFESSLGLGPTHYSVTRDIVDFLSLAHFHSHGKNPHFMRRWDGQTPYQAWFSACDSIRLNCIKFAHALLSGNSHNYVKELGYACHTLEDSFSKGHVTRNGLAAGKPGEIAYVKVFAGKDTKDHSKHDSEWKNSPWMFDLTKTAVKALLWMVYDEAETARQVGQTNIGTLRGWPAYQERWLKPSIKLAKSNAHEIDLIDVHTSGFFMDEEGLANSMYTELGTQTDKVVLVMKRLYQHHNNDSDDVAQHYVKLLQLNSSSDVTAAVKRNQDLVKSLILNLESGWTTSSERSCIKFLQGFSN